MAANSLEHPYGAIKKHLLHDFWLIVVLEENEDASTMQTLGNACKLVDEQIKLVNQMLLLEKMHRTERQTSCLWLTTMIHCVSLDTAWTLPIHPKILFQAWIKCFRSMSQNLLTAQRVFLWEPKADVLVLFALTKKTETLMTMRSFSVNCCDTNFSGFSHVTWCGIGGKNWYCIKVPNITDNCPRFRSILAAAFPPFSASDVGFQALRLGLERKNRQHIYMRLHSSEESVYANFPLNQMSGKMKLPQTLMAVFCFLFMGSTLRRLNLRTLDEYKRFAEKRPYQFIQHDPQQPCETYFFTIPSLVFNYLGSLQYYLGQQLSTFCILPKFREQSGVHQQIQKHHHQLALSLNLGDGIALSTSMSNDSEEGSKGIYCSKKAPPSTPPTHQISSTFLPYADPKMPPNPQSYSPVFYLVNKPPGKGKGDTGIAALEVKLIDWQGNVVENVQEGHINNISHSLLYPGLPNGDRMHRASRLHEVYWLKCSLTLCIHCPENVF
uniref:Uncharacterized protein n=1 Tax=Ditylenchus dipsaci TaxID=166011 RepID=A0A915DUB5_9BILA